MDLSILEERLNSELNIVNKVSKRENGGIVVNIKDSVNRTGRKNLSEETKELIGTLAHFDRENTVAKAFGVSQATVSNAKNSVSSSGPTGEYLGERDKRIKENVGTVKERVGEVALQKLEQVLSHITEDKLEKANLVSLTVAAGNLAKIGNVEKEDKGPSVNFNFFTPRTRQEDDYEVVNVVA